MTLWKRSSGKEHESHALYGINGWLVVVLVEALFCLFLGLVLWFGRSSFTFGLDDGSQLEMQIEGLETAGAAIAISSALFVGLLLRKTTRFRLVGPIIIWIGFITSASLVLTSRLTITDPRIVPGNSPVYLTPEQVEELVGYWSGSAIETLGVFAGLAVVTTIYLAKSERVRVTFDKVTPWALYVR